MTSITDPLTCQFCNKKFVNISNLKKHVATAKSCLSKRPVIDANNTIFLCKYCNKEFTQKGHLQSHYELCKSRVVVKGKNKTRKYKEENVKLKEELEKEKDTVMELEIIVDKANDRIRELELKLARKEGQIVGMKTAKPKNITNNTINNYINPKLASIPTEGLPYLTPKYIQDLVEEGYTYDHFIQGPSGIAQFVGECVTIPDNIDEDAPPRKNYLCTDIPRHKYHKYEISGWKLDAGASFLGIVFNEIKSKANEHYQTLIDLCSDTSDILLAQTRDELRLNVIAPMMMGINSKKGVKRDKLISDVRVYLRPFVSI